VIVFDEQLLEPELEESLKKWYRGSVVAVIDLRPSTIVKDDVIPQLLSRTRQHPTFITINVRDFWNKVQINQGFCVVCFKIPDTQITMISVLLKALFQEFKTKKQRAGHVFQIDHNGNCLCYNYNNPENKIMFRL
jgi:hypothetical protein